MTPRIQSKAGRYILSFLSGLPSSKRRTKQLIMLQAYIDESATDGEVLILAGYIAEADAWAAFSDDWQELLDMRPHWRSVKMREIAKSNDDERWHRAEAFYRVIEKYVSAQVCCAVPIQTLWRVADEFGSVEILKNPYYLACSILLNATARYQQRMGLQSPVDFFFDERSEKEHILIGWKWYLRGLEKSVAALTGATPIFRDDEEVLPLQAADMLAYWYNRNWREHGTVRKASEIFPWPTKVYIQNLVVEVNERSIRSRLSQIAAIVDARRYGNLKPSLVKVSFDWKG